MRKFSIRTPPGNTFVGARNSNSRSSSVDLSQTASSSPPHSFLTFISIFPIFLGAPSESARFNACHGMRRTKGRRRGGEFPPLTLIRSNPASLPRYAGLWKKCVQFGEEFSPSFFRSASDVKFLDTFPVHQLSPRRRRREDRPNQKSNDGGGGGLRNRTGE